MEISLYDIVERVIDDAFFHQTYTFSMYDYLKSNKVTKPIVSEFINSATASSLSTTVEDLDLYLEGGNDDLHKQIREAYGNLGKPTARKIRDYLYCILEDAWRYEKDKRPGRKLGSKNRKRVTK